MLLESGLAIGGVAVTQPSDIVGDVKLLSALSMENVADAVLAAGLANRDEADRLVAALYESAHDPGTFVSVARAIQVWGRLTPPSSRATGLEIRSKTSRMMNWSGPFRGKESVRQPSSANSLLNIPRSGPR